MGRVILVFMLMPYLEENGNKINRMLKTIYEIFTVSVQGLSVHWKAMWQCRQALLLKNGVEECMKQDEKMY